MLWVDCNPPWVHLDTWLLSKEVNVAAMDLGNRAVFMKLGKFETEGGVPGTEGVENGVGSERKGEINRRRNVER